MIFANVLSERGKQGVYLSESFYRVHSICAILQYTKCVFFLRSFERTGYLIRALILVSIDMIPYFLILFLLVLGFGDALYTLQKYLQSNDMTDNYFMEPSNYSNTLFSSYNLILGVWGSFGWDPQANLIFLVASVIESILMMNMMINYMEKSFEPVYFGQIMYGYKERVGIMCDIYNGLRARPNSKRTSFLRERKCSEQGCRSVKWCRR